MLGVLTHPAPISPWQLQGSRIPCAYHPCLCTGRASSPSIRFVPFNGKAPLVNLPQVTAEEEDEEHAGFAGSSLAMSGCSISASVACITVHEFSEAKLEGCDCQVGRVWCQRPTKQAFVRAAWVVEFPPVCCWSALFAGAPCPGYPRALPCMHSSSFWYACSLIIVLPTLLTCRWSRGCAPLGCSMWGWAQQSSSQAAGSPASAPVEAPPLSC